MREYDNIPMDEQEFDALLTESLTDLPPDAEVVHEITPWRKAMKRVLWGLGLTSITLNFWCLNYILPAIGMVLMLLGFRALRRENGGFTACWWITVVRTLWMVFSLGVQGTIFAEEIFGHPLVTVLGRANLVLTFVQMLCLWRALRSVREKEGFAPGAGAAAALAVWYLIICGLGLIGYSGWIISIAVLVAYILILRALHRLSRELDEAGYAVHPAPVRLPDLALAVVVFACLAVGIVVGYLCFNRYPMEWELTDGTGQDQNQEIREHLISLGYPEEALNDLTPEDLAACEGALDVVVDVEDHPVNEGRRVTTEVEPNHYYTTTVYDAEELRLTHVGVLLPGERETWKIFHHFCFTADPGFFGTEAIQLWPTDRLDGWGNRDGLTGRVLYDKDGKTYESAYYSLGDVTYTNDSIFWGSSVNTDVFAEFSLPNDGERQRGYVSYEVDEMQDGWIIDSWINYIHQTTRLGYPMQTALEARMTSGFNADSIHTVQTALQFFPNDENPEPLS